MDKQLYLKILGGGLEMEIIVLVFAVFLAYLLGSISPGYILVKKKTGRDIRQMESRSTGATNVARILGWQWNGIIVLFFDALKGFVPTWISLYFLGGLNPWTGAIGVAAILGHNFSIFLDFEGGKGVSTSLGVLIIFIGASISDYWSYPLVPAFFFFMLALWPGVIAITKMMSLANITLAVGLYLYFLCLLSIGFSPIVFGEIIFITLLLIFQHRSNIKRIWLKKERLLNL